MRVPAHRADAAVAFFEGRLKTKIVERSEPYRMEREPPCQECLEKSKYNTLAATEEDKAFKAVFELLNEHDLNTPDWDQRSTLHMSMPRIERKTGFHNHYNGAGGLYVDLIGHDDHKLKRPGKKLTDKQFQVLLRTAGAAGVDSEPQGGASDPPARHIAELDMADVLAAFKVCLTSVQTNETHKNLTGVCLRTSPGMIRFESTDGHRLTFYNLAGTDDLLPAVTIIPHEWCAEVVKRKPKGTATLALVMEDGDDETEEVRLRLILPDGERSPRIAAKFPNCDPIMPRLDHQLWTMELPAPELRALLKSMARMADDKIKPIKLEPNSHNLHISSERAEFGEQDGDVPLVSLDGDPVESFGMNAAYLLEAIAPYETATVKLSGRGALNPLRLTIPGLEHIAQVIMPLRIEW